MKRIFRKLFGLWLMMLIVALSAVALAGECSSSSILLEGEKQNYALGCTEKDTIAKNDIFTLDGAQWQYKSADAVSEATPKVKLKNLETGDSVIYAVEVKDGTTTFTLKSLGKSYAFVSASDINQMDYQLKMLSGKFSTCSQYSVMPFIIGIEGNDLYAGLDINGVKTGKLKIGEAYKTPEGDVFTISNLLYQAYAGGVHEVEFCINGQAGVQAGAKAGSSQNNAAKDSGMEVLPGGITPVTQGADLSNYPSLFVKDGQLNAFIIVGDEAKASDTLAMVDIAQGFTDSGYTVSAKATILASEISNYLSNNLIVVGNACDNKVSALLQGYPNSCTPGLKEGQGLLKLFQNDGYVQLLVTGYSSEDVRKAAKVLQNYKSYSLKGTEVIVEGTFSSPKIGELKESPAEEPKASESASESEEQSAAEPISFPAPTPPSAPPEKEGCLGCQENGNCLPYGTRLIKEGEAKFCDLTKELKSQQAVDSACQNNYECLSNQCSNAKCVDFGQQLEETKGLLEKILEWLKSWFK